MATFRGGERVDENKDIPVQTATIASDKGLSRAATNPVVSVVEKQSRFRRIFGLSKKGEQAGKNRHVPFFSRHNSP